MKQVVDQPNGHGSVIYEIGVVLMSRSPREKYCIANTCQETAPCFVGTLRLTLQKKPLACTPM